jgi:hypothetical protein
MFVPCSLTWRHFTEHYFDTGRLCLRHFIRKCHPYLYVNPSVNVTPELGLDTSKLARVLLPTCFTLVSCLTYSTLKMEANFHSKRRLTQQATQRYVPEDKTVHNHRCENFQSYTITVNILKFSLVPKTLPRLSNFHMLTQISALINHSLACYVSRDLCRK